MFTVHSFFEAQCFYFTDLQRFCKYASSLLWIQLFILIPQRPWLDPFPGDLLAETPVELAAACPSEHAGYDQSSQLCVHAHWPFIHYSLVVEFIRVWAPGRLKGHMSVLSIIVYPCDKDSFVNSLELKNVNVTAKWLTFKYNYSLCSHLVWFRVSDSWTNKIMQADRKVRHLRTWERMMKYEVRDWSCAQCWCGGALWRASRSYGYNQGFSAKHVERIEYNVSNDVLIKQETTFEVF